MRNSANTLEILQELGFMYIIDDLSDDEPFIIPLRVGEIVAVPYTAYLNDLHNLFLIYNLAQFELLITSEFDQLYSEAEGRRRVMIISLHDRLGTRPGTVNMCDRVFDHVREEPGVWFARKGEIDRWASSHRQGTPIVHRGAVAETGLPGPAA